MKNYDGENSIRIFPGGGPAGGSRSFGAFLFPTFPALPAAAALPLLCLFVLESGSAGTCSE